MKRPRWVRILLWGVGGLLLLAAGTYAAGSLLPEAHVATVERSLPVKPAVAWKMIRDFEGSASWRPNVESVSVIETRAGRLVYEEQTGFGPLRYVVEEEMPPERLVTRIVDNADFGGTWTYVLTEAPGGSRLTITENGVVYQPLFRFLARFVFGHEATMRAFADALEAELRGVAP